MQNLKGRLHYLGWSHRPWRLITDQGDLDLWPVVESLLISLSGEPASHHVDQGYMLFADPDSGDKFTYEVDNLVVLDRIDGPGFTNVYAYLNEALIRLSGRMVVIEIDEAAKSFKATADPSEQVFGVYFTGGGNSCRVPEGSEETVCKVGQDEDTCVFSIRSAEGFSCEKFNSVTARVLLDRLARNDIRARRIGSCALLGREKESATA